MRRPRARWVVLAAFLFGLMAPASGEAACPDRPPCRGCGCKGGPGYRGPDGRCVGFKELDRVCGNPPIRCVFENAPGTGENRECALAPRAKRGSAAATEAVEPAE